MRGRLFDFVLALTLLLAFVPGARAEYFEKGYYRPLTAKVGETLVADVYFGVEDVPSQCLILWQSISVTGAVPPGLREPGSMMPIMIDSLAARSPQSAFSGVPEQAGDFSLTVHFRGLACENGGTYGDRDIRADFHIVR